jgi:hypothetical protein
MYRPVRHRPVSWILSPVSTVGNRSKNTTDGVAHNDPPYEAKMADTKNGKKNSQQSTGATHPIQGKEPVKVTAANTTPGQSKSAKNPQPKISKMEAVRKTLASLGREAKPTEMQAYIKKTFGVEMTKDHISNYKGDILRKEAESAGGSATAQAATSANKPAAPKPSTPAAAVKPASNQPRAADGSSILLEDVLTAKMLLDRVGADKLRTLIDGLAQ